MKPLMLILLLAVFASTAIAQWKYVSIGAGIGMGWADDDLFDNSPVMAWRFGIGSDWTPRQRTFAAQHFFLRTGMDIVSSGSRFEMVSTYASGERKGSYEVVSVQIPLRVGWSFYLNSLKHQTKLSIIAGPSLCIGVAGKMYDSQHFERYENDNMNFDNVYSGAELFERMRHLDVLINAGAELSVGHFYFGIEWGMGLVPMRDKSDALLFFNTEPNAPVTGYYARSRKMLLNAGYQIPIKSKPKPSRSNAIFL